MVEEFLRALGASFEKNREALPTFELAIVALFTLGVVLELVLVFRRLWAKRTRLRRLAEELGISSADLTFVKGMAQRDEVAPLSLLTRLDRFEHATARALAPGAVEAEVAAETVRRLRRVLGFDRLPAHTPLLTTRELPQGTAVEVGKVHGQTFDVSETSFSVRLLEALSVAPGQQVVLSLVHAREARYELRCRVLLCLGPEADGPALIFAHDEEPRRVQQREYARVSVRGAIALKLAPQRPLDDRVRLDVVARLVDVSGGGALIACREPLPVGTLAHATFTLGGDSLREAPGGGGVVGEGSSRTAPGAPGVATAFRGSAGPAGVGGDAARAARGGRGGATALSAGLVQSTDAVERLSHRGHAGELDPGGDVEWRAQAAGTRALVKPRRAASASRASGWETARTSPARPTSPRKRVRAGSARSRKLEASARMVARSAAGSSTSSPPATLTNRSQPRICSSTFFSSTAARSADAVGVDPERSPPRGAEARGSDERLDLHEDRPRPR